MPKKEAKVRISKLVNVDISKNLTVASKPDFLKLYQMLRDQIY